jgi:tetratricopeptide (TPR) repeat protein
MMDFKEKLGHASDYLKKGDYFLAEEIYDEVLAGQEDNADALFGKAKCYFARCRYAEALESCERAREIDPDAVSERFYNQLLWAVKTNSRDYSRDVPQHSDFRDYKSKMCPNCGRSINPFFVICPFCDFDLRELSMHEVCGQCGRIMDDSEGICHYCEGIAMPHESIRKVAELCDEGFRHIRNFRIKEAKICFDKASKLDSNDANPVVGTAYCFYYLGYHDILDYFDCHDILDFHGMYDFLDFRDSHDFLDFHDIHDLLDYHDYHILLDYLDYHVLLGFLDFHDLLDFHYYLDHLDYF